MNNESIVGRLYESGKDLARNVVLLGAIYGATASLEGCASAPVSPNYTYTQQRSQFYNQVKDVVVAEVKEGEKVVVLNRREAQSIGLARTVDSKLQNVSGEQVYVLTNDGVVVYTPNSTATEQATTGDPMYIAGAEGEDSPFVVTTVLNGNELERFVQRSESRTALHNSTEYGVERQKAAEELANYANAVRTAHTDHAERTESYNIGVTGGFPSNITWYDVHVMPGGIVKLKDLEQAAGEGNEGMSYINRALAKAKGIIKAQEENPDGYVAVQIPGWDSDGNGALSTEELNASVDRFGGLAKILYISSNTGEILARHEITVVESRKDGLVKALRNAQAQNTQNKLLSPSLESLTVVPAEEATPSDSVDNGILVAPSLEGGITMPEATLPLPTDTKNSEEEQQGEEDVETPAVPTPTVPHSDVNPNTTPSDDVEDSLGLGRGVMALETYWPIVVAVGVAAASAWGLWRNHNKRKNIPTQPEEQVVQGPNDDQSPN